MPDDLWSLRIYETERIHLMEQWLKYFKAEKLWGTSGCMISQGKSS